MHEASGPIPQSVRSATATNRGPMGIAFGIPLDAVDDEMRADNGCIWVRSFPVNNAADSKTVLFSLNYE